MDPITPKEMKYNLHYGDVRANVIPPLQRPLMEIVILLRMIWAPSENVCSLKENRLLLRSLIFDFNVHSFLKRHDVQKSKRNVMFRGSCLISRVERKTVVPQT